MRKGEATRERIIARAAEVFNVYGYAGTTVADIMQAADLEKGGIYRHFASKEELALSAFDFAAARVRERFTIGITGTANAVDTLVAFIGVFRGYAQRPPLKGGCPILNTAVEADDTHPVLRERARALVEEWRTMIRTVVMAGQARGEVRSEVDPEQLALLCIATMEGAVMLSQLLRDSTPLQVAYDHLHQHLEVQVRAA
jgi:TetR/AcrR family transcriptional regulator, transcriptional repressor for nem operon